MSLFDSYRAVGLITSGRMSAVRRLGDAKNFVTCPAGRAFYVYDCAHLRVALVSKQVPCDDEISCLSASGSDKTYVAAGRRIFCFDRAQCIGEFHSGEDDLPAHEYRVDLLCSFGGGNTLVSLDVNGALKVWNCSTMSLADVPECNLGSEFRPKFLLHPKTYLNKVLVGGESGVVQLWNFRSGKLVHTFNGFPAKLAVECAEQSPAVDVVAFGLADGSVVLHNLRFDKTLFTLRHSSKSRVTALAFLSDTRVDVPAMLASGTKDGEVALWDLNSKIILHSLGTAHSGGVNAVQFLPGEFALLSCGLDNALRTWRLDSTTYQLRRLKFREGHWRPPTKLRFHPQGATIATLSSGMDGRALQIVSAGSDRTLRSFHCALDNHAKELSQKCVDRRLPRITSLATSEAREHDWYNVVTTHEGENDARVWRFETGVLGEGGLNMRTKGYSVTGGGKRKRGGNDSDYLAAATSCAISDCGNFAFVGSATGIVSKYNLQSGRFIGSYPKQIWDGVDPKSRAAQQKVEASKRKRVAAPASVFATTGEAKTSQFSVASDETKRHAGMVTGVCVDGLNDFVLTTGLDGVLIIWDSETFDLVESIDLGSPISQMERSRDGGLVALALENLSLAVFDPVARKVVRTFSNCHQAKITDIGFSPDTKWLVSSSMDLSLKIWDIPTARCVSWMSFPSAVTSFAFSPSNEYIATSHVDCLAICVWTNKVHFGLAKADRVARAGIPLELPCFIKIHDDADDDEGESDSSNNEQPGDAPSKPLEDLAVAATKDQRGMIALSEPNAGASRWFTLWHLDLIKERNKPLQPAEKPKQVPFFLPTSAQELELLRSTKNDEHEETLPASRIISSKSGNDLFTTKSALAEELEEFVTKAKLNRFDDISDDISDDDADDEEAKRFTAVKRARVYAPFVSKLKSMTPSAIDFELRSLTLGPEDEEGARALQVWIEWILDELKARTNFEMVESILGRLVRIHGDTFIKRDELRRTLESIRSEHRQAWTSLQGMMQKCLCYVESFSQLNSF